MIVFTGDGKGKTTAALGMALRAVGHNLQVAVVQFIKVWSIGEHQAAARLAPNLKLYRLGRGFVQEPTAEHVAAATKAMAFVRQCLRGGKVQMVVADEILTAVGLKLITAEQVESLLEDRPRMCIGPDGAGGVAVARREGGPGDGDADDQASVPEGRGGEPGVEYSYGPAGLRPAAPAGGAWARWVRDPPR